MFILPALPDQGFSLYLKDDPPPPAILHPHIHILNWSVASYSHSPLQAIVTDKKASHLFTMLKYKKMCAQKDLQNTSTGT